MERKEQIAAVDGMFRQVNKKFRERMEQLFDGNMTVTEFIFLRHLHDAGPSRSSDLSRTMNVSLSHITNVCDRLIEKGFVYRKRPAADRRTIEMGLTAEGERVFLQLQQLRQQFIGALFGDMDDNELTQLANLLKKMDTYLTHFHAQDISPK